MYRLQTNKKRIDEKLDLKRLITDRQLKESYRIEVENRYGILNNEEPLEGEEELDGDWRKLERAYNETAKELVPKQERRRGQKMDDGRDPG